MKRSLTASVVAVLAVVLVGCSPSTDAAYTNCHDTLAQAVVNDEDITVDEGVDKLVEISELCAAAAKEDPEGFIAEWGD